MLARCEARFSSQPPAVWAIFGCPGGAFRRQRMRCISPSKLARMVAAFVDDLVMMLKSEVGLQQQLDTLQQFCGEREKNKSHGV